MVRRGRDDAKGPGREPGCTGCAAVHSEGWQVRLARNQLNRGQNLFCGVASAGQQCLVTGVWEVEAQVLGQSLIRARELMKSHF